MDETTRVAGSGQGKLAPEDTAPSDSELIAAYNSGDVQAFKTLYRRHRDCVANLALRFTGDPDLALDVMQDTFLYLVRKSPGFKLSARLQTFLYPAVKHLSLAARRKSERFQVEEKALEEPAVAATPGEGPTDALALALAGLSEEHREVLLLRFVDDLTLGEIAAAQQIPLGTVKFRLHNALTALRNDQRMKNYFLT